MSCGMPSVKVTPVLCSQASWQMQGWKPGNALVSTERLIISEITTLLVSAGRLVRFLLISPKEGLDWTDEMKLEACFVVKCVPEQLLG